LGIERLTVSTVTVGGGTTRGSHGSIPLPAPAVLRVLADAGAPVVGAVPYEACTPTGAAICAAAAAGSYGPMPEMVVERVGVGAGGRDPKERANLLRLVIGREVAGPGRNAAAAHQHDGHEHHHAENRVHEHHDDGTAAPQSDHGSRVLEAQAAGLGSPAAHGYHDHDVPKAHEARDQGDSPTHAGGEPAPHTHGEHVSATRHEHDHAAPAPKPVVIETNVDDLDPRLWPAALAALLAAGASDAWLTPILMKKGRPAHTVHVLCRPEVIDAVRSALVRHTTTIGMRSYEIDKYALERRYTYINVDGHQIGVKIALDRGEVVNASVEYENAAAAAAALGRPLKVVIAQATALAAEQYRPGRDGAALPISCPHDRFRQRLSFQAQTHRRPRLP
jgi:uncharacterized protein (DUF111 family)